MMVGLRSVRSTVYTVLVVLYSTCDTNPYCYTISSYREWPKNLALQGKKNQRTNPIPGLGLVSMAKTGIMYFLMSQNCCCYLQRRFPTLVQWLYLADSDRLLTSGETKEKKVNYVRSHSIQSYIVRFEVIVGLNKKQNIKLHSYTPMEPDIWAIL